jgi:uncharacterized protein (TIGR00369 family)
MSRLLVAAETPNREGDPQFEMGGWIDTAPFEQLLDMRICGAAAGKSELRMPFTVKLAQGGGIMHGGALTALADTAVAMAVKSLLPEGTFFATTHLSLRFLAPVKEGEVTAFAAVEGPFGRTLKGRADLVAEEGRKVAEFEAELRIARGQGYVDSAAELPPR